MALPTVLLCSTLPARTQRHLRRHLSNVFLVHPVQSGWIPTAYFITASPSPTHFFLCALAAVRTVIVTPQFAEACIAAGHVVDSAPYALPTLPHNDLLPANHDALWAGRMSPSAHAFWRTRVDAGGDSPLTGHRVCVLGNLRPAGAAGIAAVSNEIVLDLLRAADACIVPDASARPTFAVVASGLHPAACPQLQALVKGGVLCVASAFLIDLLARVSADPADYIMVEEQKTLCGPLLDRASCMRYLTTLPVSREQLPVAEVALKHEDLSGSVPCPREEATEAHLGSRADNANGGGEADKTCDATGTGAMSEKRGTAGAGGTSQSGLVGGVRESSEVIETRKRLQSGEEDEASRGDANVARACVDGEVLNVAARSSTGRVIEQECEALAVRVSDAPVLSGVDRTDSKVRPSRPSSPTPQIEMPTLRRSRRKRAPPIRHSSDFVSAGVGASPRDKRPRVSESLSSAKRRSSTPPNAALSKPGSTGKDPSGENCAASGKDAPCRRSRPSSAARTILEASRKNSGNNSKNNSDCSRKRGRPPQWRARKQEVASAVKDVFRASSCGVESMEIIDLCLESDLAADASDKDSQTRDEATKQGENREKTITNSITRSQKLQCSYHVERVGGLDAYAYPRGPSSPKAAVDAGVETSPTTPAVPKSSIREAAEDTPPIKNDSLSSKTRKSRSPRKRPRGVNAWPGRNASVRLDFSPLSHETEAVVLSNCDGVTKGDYINGRGSGECASALPSITAVGNREGQRRVVASDKCATAQLKDDVGDRSRSSKLRLKQFSQLEEDLASEVDAVSELPTTCRQSASEKLRAHSIFSLEDGFNFVIKALGGRPTKRDVDSMLAFKTRSSSQEPGSRESSFVEDDALISPPSAQDEQSPVFAEESVSAGYGHRHPKEDCPGNDVADWGLEDGNRLPISAGNVRSNRDTGYSQRVSQILRMPVPQQSRMLSGVVLKKFVTLQNGSEVCIAYGNDLDDRRCEGELEFIEWVLAAERYVGFSSCEERTLELNSRTFASRRIISSLAESRVLIDLSSPGVLSDSQCVVLTGICVRLVCSGYSRDSSSPLLADLLSLRDAQLLSGFDSLEIVASQRDLSSVPLRHRAVASIWCVLLREFSGQSSSEGFWPLFNQAVTPRVNELFLDESARVKNVVGSLSAGLRAILELIVAVAYMFALRVDFVDDPESEALGPARERGPPNWDLLCYCLQKFTGDSGKASGDLDEMRNILPSFLRDVATFVAGKVWAVNDRVLGTISQTISSLNEGRQNMCYCIAPPLFVASFRRLDEPCTDRSNLTKQLKTPCDCYFYMGWLYAMGGDGNAMKRAMVVIKNAGYFTRGSSPELGLSRVVNHHVGVTLCVGDKLASSHPSGEELLCRTLTSKCPRLETVLSRFATSGKEDDSCWRTTVDAIMARCRELLLRGGRVDPYSEWLCQSVVGTFYKMKRSMEKGFSVPQKEVLRAQEVIFTNLALLTLGAIREITDSIHRKVIHGDETCTECVVNYVQKCGKNVRTFARFAADIVSQMRSNPGEAMSKSKAPVLRDLLVVVGNEMKLVAAVRKARLRSEADSSQSCGKDVALCLISESSLRDLLTSVLTSELLIDDLPLAISIKRSAAGSLGHLLELEGAEKLFSYHEEDKRNLEKIVGQCDFDGRKHGKIQGQSTRVQEGDVLKSRLRNYIRIEFWSVSFCGNWAAAALQGSRNLLEMAVCSAVAGVGYLEENREDELYKASVRSVVNGLGRVEALEGVVNGWTEVSQIVLRDNGGTLGDDNDDGRKLPGSVLFVEQILTEIANRWETRKARAFFDDIEYTVRGWVQQWKKFRLARQAILVYTHLFRLQAQLGEAVCNSVRSGWVQGRLQDIREGILTAQRHSWDAEPEKARAVWTAAQRRVIDALATIEPHGRDLETRVSVVRIGHAFVEADWSADGLWRTAQVVVLRPGESEGRVEERRRRIEKTGREWQRVLFHAVVEDALCGQAVSSDRVTEVLWRFEKAAQVLSGSSGHRGALIVDARRVVRRARASRIGALLESDIRVCGLWRRIVAMVEGPGECGDV